MELSREMVSSQLCVSRGETCGIGSVLLFSPIFLPMFRSGLWLLEGKGRDKLLPMLQHTLPTAIVANWALWIPAQARKVLSTL